MKIQYEKTVCDCCGADCKDVPNRSGTVPEEGLASFYLCTDCMNHYFKYGGL